MWWRETRRDHLEGYGERIMNSIDIRLLGFEPDDKRMAAASMQAFREIESMWQCGTINDLEFVRLGKELWGIGP